jgi:hypothetical protein
MHASRGNSISPSLLHGPHGPPSTLAATCGTMLQYIDDGLACMDHIYTRNDKIEMNLGEIEIEVEVSFMYYKHCVTLSFFYFLIER